MKKLTKLFALLITAQALLFAVACNDEEVKIDSVSVVESTIPQSMLTTEVSDKLDDIQLKIVKSDDSEQIINVSESMISASDLAKLANAGTHTINVTYEGYNVSITIVVTAPSDGGGSGEDINPEPEEITYSVLIKDIANKPLSNFYVTFYDGDEIVDEGYTGNTGLFETELLPDIYEVIIEGREGYYLNQDSFETDLLGTQIVVEVELESLEDEEASYDHYYELGDVMYDFTVTDIKGNELDLYDLLKEYKAVILNFWYTTCSACIAEFPYMIDAYESTYETEDGQTRNYSDDIVIIAVNPTIAGGGEDLSDVELFAESMGLSFNVVLDTDGNKNTLETEPYLTNMFGVMAYPTTVIIDRFGLIAELEEGAVTATDKWTTTFDHYISDDYYPNYNGSGDGAISGGYVKPDIEQAPSEELEAAANGTNYDGSQFDGKWHPEEETSDAEYSWPFIVDTFDNKTVIRPSNEDKNYSFATVYTTVTLKKGEAFAFDYFSDTEEYDILYVIVDGVLGTQISGTSNAWETSYAYVAIEDGTYEIGLCYLKDQSYSMGDDTIYITNVRIVEQDDIDKPTYIYREAAYGQMNQFTMSYSKYASVYYNEADGYYHVGDSSNPQDTDPLLFADMLSGTRWNQSDIYSISLENKCIGADGVDYNALIEEYAVYASNSTIGYCPVTLELANALKQIVKALGDQIAASNENQWLELCVYYTHYGTDGSELGMPTYGVCPWEPIVFDGDALTEAATASGTFDRIILPRGLIFSFTPTQSGVYSIYSEGEIETVGWICDADAVAIAECETGLREFAMYATQGIALNPNFVIFQYLEAGQEYLYRCCFEDMYLYDTINVAVKYVDEELEIFTIASPGSFTTSDDDMSLENIISSNYIDVELGEDGYYHVVDSKAKDDFVYCDVIYVTSIMNYSLTEALGAPFYAFDFSKDEFGKQLYDENGYWLYTQYDENDVLQSYYICVDAEGNYYYDLQIGDNDHTEENGYTYLKYTEEELESLENADFTEYVQAYIDANKITDTESELYGCVKVDEAFARVLSLFMDKYTFADVEYSWVKLCYYFKYIGA